MVLGSDLEETANHDCGWNAALDRLGPVNTPATIVRVPHHGSVTGHSVRMWSEIVHEKALAALTPFSRGITPLPTTQDVARIKSLASQVFLTAAAKKLPPVKQNDRLTGSMRRVTRSLHEAEGLPGRVTLRGPLQLTTEGQITVELAEPARRV
jgi:hypothetical protein